MPRESEYHVSEVNYGDEQEWKPRWCIVARGSPLIVRAFGRGPAQERQAHAAAAELNRNCRRFARSARRRTPTHASPMVRAIREMSGALRRIAALAATGKGSAHPSQTCGEIEDEARAALAAAKGGA